MFRSKSRSYCGNLKKNVFRKNVNGGGFEISNSEVLKSFQDYAVELDERNDRYERIYKIGRDIIIESKRLIFALHTFQKETLDAENVLAKAKVRLINLIRNEFYEIMKELHELDVHQYLRAYSFGVQEFIEAFSFYYYLRTNSLLTYEEVQKFIAHALDESVKFEDTNEFLEKEEFEESEKNVPNDDENDKKYKERSNYEVKKRAQFSQAICNTDILTLEDYVLGLNDLSGELMRFCINKISAGDIKKAFDISKFLNRLYIGMLSVGFVNREYNRKMITFRHSIRKVEFACYTVCVRGSEIPKHMIASVLESDNEHEDDVHF